jgi:urease accessory protein
MRMIMVPPPMRTEAAVALAQWLSPSFPVGAFAYSHGLETAVRDGRLADFNSVRQWIETLLLFGSGRSDAILLAAAYGARGAELMQIDATARAYTSASERRQETMHQGAAFARTFSAVWGQDLAALSYPVAIGSAAALQNLPLNLTLAMYLHAFAANLVSAAVRLVPLGQTDGQRALTALAPAIRATAHEAETATLDDLCGSAIASEIAAMRHETLQPRLFRS